MRFAHALIASLASGGALWVVPNMDTRPTVLIVEDDACIAALIADALEDETDARIRMVHNGRDAIGLLAAQRIDLVILDYQLPGATGIEVYDAMRRDPRTQRTPVLFITANDRRAEFDHRGFTYIRKPFNLFELLAMVTTRLEEHHAQSAS